MNNPIIAEEIQELISAGRFEYSLEKSNLYLTRAVTKAQTLKSSQDYHISLLAKEAYKELALNEARPSTRTELWFKALEALKWSTPAEQDQHASNFADLVVDICQDTFSDISNSRRHSLLKQAKIIIDKTTRETKENEYKAIALIRKSAIIRLQAKGHTPEDRLRLLSEAFRCSSLALELYQHAAIILECALVEWDLSRLQKNDKKYNEKLKHADELFNHQAVKNTDLGPLATSRFYRLTYRYYDACLTFPQLTKSSKNRRRILRGVHIYAESAIQLSNLQYPSVVITEHLNKAMNLLELAISSGCKSAREVISLAHIRCLKDGTQAGLTVLEDLCPKNRELSWEQVLEMLSENIEGDLPAEGFALGITDSTALTRLGTFTNRFLKNSILAETLFRASVRMNPQDPIAQTNLARFLVKRGSSSDLKEAERIIQLAQTFADRRFSWWRPVQIELKRLKNENNLPLQNQNYSYTERIRSFESVQHIKKIRQHYEKLKTCEDPQLRGYELEKLVYAISSLSFGFQYPSYRIERPLINKTQQIDAYIEHRNNRYRCECKWQKEKASYDDILKFEDKIDVTGVSGIFISMSGFTEQAIKKTWELRANKAIILIDGEEVDLLMTGSMHFDDILTIKRRAFDISSKTYYKIDIYPSDG